MLFNITYFKKRYNLSQNNVHIISLSCNTVPPPKYGGIELVIANLCEGLGSLGCNVILYSPGECIIRGVKHVQTLKHPSPPLNQGGSANNIDHLLAIKEQLVCNYKKGDILLFNHPEQFRFLKKKLGVRFFIGANFYEIAHWLDVGVYNNVIYPSKSLYYAIKKRGCFVPHGLKLKFCMQEKRRSDNMFYAGRITPDKGVHIAVQSAARLGVKLLIAGPNPHTDFSKKILSNPYVEYLGELNYEELYEYYSTTKCHIYLSQYIEPFGLTIIEALAAGSPVITTGKGGTGEIVSHGVNGFYADSVDGVVSSYKKIGKLSSHDCSESVRKYSVRRMSKGYLDIFTQTGCDVVK